MNFPTWSIYLHHRGFCANLSGSASPLGATRTCANGQETHVLAWSLRALRMSAVRQRDMSCATNVIQAPGAASRLHARSVAAKLFRKHAVCRLHTLCQGLGRSADVQRRRYRQITDPGVTHCEPPGAVRYVKCAIGNGKRQTRACDKHTRTLRKNARPFVTAIEEKTTGGLRGMVLHQGSAWRCEQ